MTRLTLHVSYTTLAVLDPALENPFNYWRDAHVAQGFSWRPGSVSFAALDDGELEVDLRVARAALDPLPGTVRAIRVPFTVPGAGAVAVASIGDERPVELPPGPYALIYETGRDGERSWARLTFVPDPAAGFAVLVADPELHPPSPLLTEAEPAT